MKKLIYLTLAAGLVMPYTRAWADYEKKESAQEERKESREHQQAEEQEAIKAYQRKVTKFGKESAEAKKAWTHVVREYKEHGDTPPSPDAAAPTPAK